MKYKTTIEIVTDAVDKDEAVEIAGEYLSGNLISGARMRCRTKPAYTYRVRAIAGAAAVFAVVALGGLFASNAGKAPAASGVVYGTDAIQPLLKTSISGKNDVKFRKEWQARQLQEALEYVKK